MTRAQFAQTPAAKKPGASYQTYLNYIRNRRASTAGGATPPVDPFALMSPGQINQTVGRYVDMYGQPMNDAQVQASAQAQIDPIVRAITQTINQNTASQAAAEQSGAQALADYLSKMNFSAPYQAAENIQSANDQALQSALTAAGQGIGQDIGSRLAAINDPTVGVAQQEAAQEGAQGAARIAKASSASLGNLLANAAAAGNFGAKQPGLALAQGQANLARLYSNAQNEIGSQTAQVLQQLPQIVSSLRAQNQTLRGQRASAASDLYTTLTGQNLSRATAKAGLANTAADNRTSYANTFGYDPVTGQPVKGYHVGKNGGVVKDTPPPKPGSAKTFKGTDGRTYQINTKTGVAELVPGQPGPKTPKAKAQAQKLPGTAGERNGARQQAAFAFYGNKDPNNPANNSDPVDYQTAYKAMIRHGFAPNVAKWALGQYYTQPGGRGRSLGNVKPPTGAHLVPQSKLQEGQAGYGSQTPVAVDLQQGITYVWNARKQTWVAHRSG